MDFSITNLMDRNACIKWIQEHFHPDGQKCLHCQAGFDQSRWFRKTKRSKLDVRRCKNCQGLYNLYSGTVFEGRNFRPEQTVLFIRGICQSQSTAQLARELGISRTMATEVRHKIQANAARNQPQTPLDDLEVEVDEMFQNAGEKK